MELAINPPTAVKWVSPFSTPLLALPVNPLKAPGNKRQNTNPRMQSSYTYKDEEAQPIPLTDITQKGNILNTAEIRQKSEGTNEAEDTGQTKGEAQKKLLPNNMGNVRSRTALVSETTTPHRAVKSRQILCGNNLKNSRLKSMKSMKSFRSPIHLCCVSPQGKFIGFDRRAASPRSCCLMSPTQYNMITEQRRAILKEYFKQKKGISKKYIGMLSSLKTEEAAATKCAVIRAKVGKILRDIECVLDEIKCDYAITTNLLLQQKVVEEEELLKTYKLCM